MIRIDKFVQKHSLSFGSMKGDVEGYAATMIRGAIETVLRDDPIFSFSSHHNFTDKRSGGSLEEECATKSLNRIMLHAFIRQYRGSHLVSRSFTRTTLLV
jgi:DNA-directed RNA polymerase specialized sigma subunit